MDSTITTCVGGQVPTLDHFVDFIKIIIILCNRLSVNFTQFFNPYPELKVINSFGKVIFVLNILVNDWLAKIGLEMILRIQSLRLTRHCKVSEIIIGDFLVSITPIIKNIQNSNVDTLYKKGIIICPSKLKSFESFLEWPLE